MLFHLILIWFCVFDSALTPLTLDFVLKDEFFDLAVNVGIGIRVIDMIQMIIITNI